MRWSVLLSFATLGLAGLICPDSNPANCYSDLFVPEDEWKEVREGQMLPSGLDIQLAMDGSGKKEARIASYMGSTDGKQVVVVEQEPEYVVKEPLDPIELVVEPVKEPAEPLERPQYTHDTDEDLFYESLYCAINSYEIPTPHLMKCMEVLSELGSDADFGLTIAENPLPFLAFAGIYDCPTEQYDNGDESLKDISTRTLAASLRNNEEALKTFASYFTDKPDLLTRLLDTTDESLLKRRLGLMGSLIVDDEFETAFKGAHFDLILLKLYPRVAAGSQTRIVNLLDDIERKYAAGTALDDSEETTEESYSRLIQDRLMRMHECDEECAKLLGNLEKLNKGADKEHMQPEFRKWLLIQEREARGI